MIHPYEQTGVYNIRYVHNDWLQLELDEQLKVTKGQTSSFAWLIKDKPELEWSENYRNYLDALKK